VLDFDPMSVEIQNWINDVRDLIDDLTKPSSDLPVDFLLYASVVTDYDMMQQVYSEFPYMVIVTVCVAFVAMGIFMGSVFTVIRLFFTLGIPLAAVFGLGVLVYQDGILGWLGWSHLGEKGSFYWAVPIICFSASLGLALDYDCFIMARIKEFRQEGYTMRESIARAMAASSGIICSAGLIMAVALGGQLISSNPSLCQIGWMMASAVLIFCLIITTLLVPSTLSFFDRVAWWPTAMPSLEDEKSGSSPSSSDNERSLSPTCEDGVKKSDSRSVYMPHGGLVGRVGSRQANEVSAEKLNEVVELSICDSGLLR